MDVPLEITYRGVERIEAVDELVRRKAAKLEQVCGWMQSCRVTIEKDQQHQAAGNPFRVRLDITVPPGHELAIRRQSSGGDLHNELPTIVRNAFDAARRKLQKLAEQQKGKMKSHPEQEVNGIVERVFPEEGYGFIRNIDDREVYFHKNSVINEKFESLRPGAGVTYVEEIMDKGLGASTVHVVGAPGRPRQGR
jgi:cold shock CspA family protein